MPYSPRTHKVSRPGRKPEDKRTGAALAAKKLRSTARWQKVRLLALQSNPMCMDPFFIHKSDKVAVLAEQVHHIKGLATHPELALDPTNLAPLCVSCHAKVEDSERKGVDTTVLFDMPVLLSNLKSSGNSKEVWQDENPF